MRIRRRYSARTIEHPLGLMNPLIDVVFLILIYFVDLEKKQDFQIIKWDPYFFLQVYPPQDGHPPSFLG